MTSGEIREIYGPEYPSAILWQGQRLALKQEGRFERIFVSVNGTLEMHISRFMDGSASITYWGLRVNWWRWNHIQHIEFCNACNWLHTNPDFPKILRFLIKTGEYAVCSSIAVMVSETLPKNEAFGLLLRALKQTTEDSANLTQGIALTQHPEVQQTLQRHLNTLWLRPGLWDDDVFNNWIAYDVICCIAHLLESGASPDTFESKVRLLLEHPCAGNRESCSALLGPYFPWLS
jgi:hypothetical protein